jgi:hypothetical protein
MGLGWLARELDRVGRHAAPLDRALQHTLEHRHRLADRLDPDARGLELGTEARDRLRRELAQLQGGRAARQRVPVHRRSRRRAAWRARGSARRRPGSSRAAAASRRAAGRGGSRPRRGRGASAEVVGRPAGPPALDERVQAAAAAVELGQHPAGAGEPEVGPEVERILDRVELLDEAAARARVAPADAEAPDGSVGALAEARLDAARSFGAWPEIPPAETVSRRPPSSH